MSRVGRVLLLLMLLVFGPGAGEDSSGPAPTLTPATIELTFDSPRSIATFTFTSSLAANDTFTWRCDTLNRAGDGKPATDFSSRPDAQVRFDFTPAQAAIAPGQSQEVRVALDHGGRLLAGAYQAAITVHDSQGRVCARGSLAVRVPVSLTVTSLDSLLDAGKTLRGPVTTSARFRIEANVQRVQATLVTTSMRVIPTEKHPELAADIPPDTAAAVRFAADEAQIVGDGAARFEHRDRQIAGRPAWSTSAVQIDSQQPFGFRHDVSATIVWRPDGPLPAGDYDGQILLLALPISPGP